MSRKRLPWNHSDALDFPRRECRGQERSQWPVERVEEECDGPGAKPVPAGQGHKVEEGRKQRPGTLSPHLRQRRHVDTLTSTVAGSQPALGALYSPCPSSPWGLRPQIQTLTGGPLCFLLIPSGLCMAPSIFPQSQGGGFPLNSVKHHHIFLLFGPEPEDCPR